MIRFDITPSERAAYVPRPLNPSRLHPGRIAVRTVGCHGHDTFAAWSRWLRENYLKR